MTNQTELTAERVERAIDIISRARIGLFQSTIDGDRIYPHMETALAALREVREREKGCEYCEKHAYVTHIEYDVPMFMNFCPVCGRRLTEGSGK